MSEEWMNFNYVGIKPCGCCTAALKVDSKTCQKDVISFMRRMVESGRTVEKHDDEWVREHFRACSCPQHEREAK